MSDFAEAISDLQKMSRAPATLAAYKSDLRQFAKFCERHGLQPSLPLAPYVVASFIAAMDTEQLAVATIARRLAAISSLHTRGGFDDPTKSTLVQETIDGLRRSRASRGDRPNRVQPLSLEALRAIADTLTDSMLDRRDWAILLLGFAGLLRRSEIAALRTEDVEWRADGIVLHIRRSKTDQTGEGQVVGIPTGQDPALCPVFALKSYLAAAGHRDGALFRNLSPATKHHFIDPRVVARAVKRLGARVNLDPARFAGHSLRAGGATQLAQAGVDLVRIVVHGRWNSPQTVTRHYIRPATTLGSDNPMRTVL